MDRREQPAGSEHEGISLEQAQNLGYMHPVSHTMYSSAKVNLCTNMLNQVTDCLESPKSLKCDVFVFVGVVLRLGRLGALFPGAAVFSGLNHLIHRSQNAK